MSTHFINITVDTDWFEVLKILENYCSKRGWEIEYSATKVDEAFPDTNKIVLNQKHNSETMCYFLMHELGHMLMILDDPDYEVKFKVLERNRQTQTYRVGCVEEELCAWSEGLRLAQELGLELNLDKFEELKAKSVSSYMMWALRPKIKYNNKKAKKTTL